MTFPLITLVTLAAVALFFVRRRAKPSPKAAVEVLVSMAIEGSINAGFGIPMTEEEVELERQYNEEIMKLLESRIVTSGFFRPEKIPDLMAKLRGASIPFGRTNTRVVFDGDAILTVEEKRALGLNTRMKYSKTFVEYFDPSAFKTIEPKATLECMHVDAFHRVSRKKELLSLKKLGFVKQVKIHGDRERIKRFKKIHRIEEVPELPLPGCNSPFCACWFEAILPNDVRRLGTEIIARRDLRKELSASSERETHEH